ncbi:DUF7511 domain-containing protein [Haladaptatus sp. NG-WS-4]
MVIDYRTKQDGSTTKQELTGTLVRYEDQPDEYTIYPRGVDGDLLMTRWITAREGSYVGLESMR